MYRKMIVYDRKTGDFAMYINGELIGFAPTYLQGESRLNKLVYDLLTKPGTVLPTIEPPAPIESSAPSDDACVA